jgi:hypothetical protein
VAAVVVPAPTHDNRAWWPSAEPSSENPEVMGAWTYTVTLADGSTRRLTR